MNPDELLEEEEEETLQAAAEEMLKEANTLSFEDKKKQAFAKILEFITNNFYAAPDHPVVINIDKVHKGANYYDHDGGRIVLASEVLDAFGALNLPRFVVYYHELGHLLFSEGYTRFIKSWEKIDQGPLQWKESYAHLLNWIEDFYIEDRLLKDYSYLTDVMNCIIKLPPDYNIQAIEYAFNWYYVNKAPTPALSYMDQLTFKGYITRLMALRDYRIIPFGHGILTNLSIRPSNDTKYALLIVEFYNWCVSKKIFPPDQPLPELSTPIGHLESPGSGDPSTDPDPNGGPNPNPDPAQQTPSSGNPTSSKQGSYSDHSHKVGKVPGQYIEKLHVNKKTNALKDELVQENRLIEKELLDMTQSYQADQFTLDGLFTQRYRKTAVIQNKIILPNFYNPNRLVDQLLFKRRQHTYMNVAVYRDISGSTEGDIHNLMHYVCEQLIKDLPVPITYYLYSSGQISVVQMPYVPWPHSDETPKEYANNALFNQLDGGTNSGAIADVITEQLSDKWLNIIVTDGDLTDLMGRDNIYALLKNVFVIAVNSTVEENLLGISVNEMADMAKINPALTSISFEKGV